MAGWKLYEDAACTVEFSGTWTLIHATDLSDNPQDDVLYYANVDDDPGDNQILQKQAQSNPGVDDLLLSIQDANVGSGHEASEITLAQTAGALDTNTAGASLSLGPTILSGVSAAEPIHIRVENAVTTVGNSTELSVAINANVDSAV